MVSRNKYYDILNDHFGEVDGTEFKKYCIVTCGSEYGLLLHDF